MIDSWTLPPSSHNHSSAANDCWWHILCCSVLTQYLHCSMCAILNRLDFEFQTWLMALCLLRIPFQWCYQSVSECNSILLGTKERAARKKEYVNIICFILSIILYYEQECVIERYELLLLCDVKFTASPINVADTIYAR